MEDITLYEGDNELNIGLVPIPLPEARLFGIVTDANTGSPLSVVKVSLNGLSVYTSASGQYQLSGLEPGRYIVTFEKSGYETATR